MPIRKINNTFRSNSTRIPTQKNRAQPKTFEKIIHNSMNNHPHKSLKKYSMKQLRQPSIATAKWILKNPIHNFLTNINRRLDSEDIEIISNILRGDIAHHSGKLPEELNEGDIIRYFK